MAMIRGFGARTGRAAVAVLGVFLLVPFLIACDVTLDPDSGQTRVRTSVPGTPEHAERLQRQWDSCVRQFSESVCERRGVHRPPSPPRNPNSTAQ